MMILFLHPSTNRKADQAKKDFLVKFADKNSQIEYISLDEGPAFMDLYSHEAFAAPHIMQKVKWANEERYDVIVIDCFLEPCIHAAREISKIPVIGPFESSVSLALQLGRKFSILSFLENSIPQVERQVIDYGVERRLASIRTITTPVLEYGYNVDKVTRELIDEARLAIEKDKAEVIILGCTLLFNIAPRMMEELGVPVIDPLLASLKTSELVAKTKLSLSKAYLYREPYKIS
jgi:allantoin racemase